MRHRSRIFAFMLRSLKIRTPQMNEIITELLRTRDTTDIIEDGSFSEVKYAKSARLMNMDINGIAQLQRNGVVLCRDGHQMTAHMTPIIMN